MASSRRGAADLEDTRDLVPPRYSGDPLTLDHFFRALDIYGLQLCVGMTRSDREEYLFNRFCHRLPKDLQTLYLQDLADGKIKGYKQAKKWLEREERVDAPEQVSKLWKAVTLVHNGNDIFLYDWRDYQREYYLERSKVEDWYENDECRRIMNLFPSSWRKRIVKEEHKRAKNLYTAKMMVPSTTQRKIKEWVRKRVTANAVFPSLQNALLVRVDTEREWNGHTLNLQQVPRRMTTDEVFEFVGEEVRKEYKAHHQGRAVASAGRQVAHVEGCGYGDERLPDSEGPASSSVPAAHAKDSYTNEEAAVYVFVAHNLSNQAKDRSKWHRVNRKQRKEPRRVELSPLTFKEYITKYPKGYFVCYGRSQAHNHDHKTCKWYAEDKAASARANPDRKLKSERQRPQGIREVQAELQKLVGLRESLEKMLRSEKSPKVGMPQAASPSTAAH